MIIVDCEQGTDEWFQARCGIPTSSHFGLILSPTGKPSTSAKTYRRALLGEWLSGQPMRNRFSSVFVDEGTEKEPEARSFYEFEYDVDTKQIGLAYKDEKKNTSCSPDGLIEGFTDGLEIKCPIESTHIGYLIDDKLPTTYKPQVQGNLWVTGYKRWRFLSYCPPLPPFHIIVERDEEWLGKFESELNKFHKKLEEEKQILIGRGLCPPTK